MFREFFADIRSQKLRTGLTVLGIAWGTVAVVVLLAFGVGLERQTKKRFHGLGDRIVILFGGRTTKAFAGFPNGRNIQITEADATLLGSEVAEIEQISPEYIARSKVRRGVKAANPAVTGILPVYGDMRNIIPQAGGRWLNQQDVDDRRRVAVLGDELATLLFGEQSPIGEQVYLGDTPFIVIGVMQPKLQNSSYQQRDKDRIFIPASTHFALFGRRFLNNIVYRATSPELTKVAEKRVYETLGRKYRFDPADEDALGVWDTSEWETRFGAMFVAFNAFFGIVGTFTLLVGGIGVANIMYIVVRERTREIGIRRAVGATRRDILIQFFVETCLIVGMGAFFGMLLSIGLVKATAELPIQDAVGSPVISPLVMLVTLVLLAVVAFVAGLFPARRASRLDPIEALRTERMLRILLEEFLGDLKAQRTRAILTFLAVAWGALAIVLLLAFGEGLKRSLRDGLLGAGERIFMIYGGETSKTFAGLAQGRRIRLVEDDLPLLLSSIPAIDRGSISYGKWGAAVSVGRERTTSFLEGVAPDHEVARHMEPAEGGRFISLTDIGQKRRVVFLGNDLADKLFGKGNNPVGRTMIIDGLPFVVIGVLKKKFQDSSNNGPDADRAVIPYSTFRTIYGFRFVNHIIVRPRDASLGPSVKAEIFRVLGKKYRFDAADERALGMWDFIESEKENLKVGLGIQIFMGLVGAFTLLVAGVGVANIMYVVVRERTHEIGVKLALGARKRHIMSQFMFEAMAISITGGLVGLAAAAAIVAGVDTIPAEENPAMQYILNPRLSWPIALGCVALLVAVGLVAGILPARKAAAVDPVESLRYE